MADKTGIEWTDATWSPTRGCSRVSAGCMNCYAESVANRFSGTGLPYEGLIAKGGQWNGQIKLVPEKLDEPLRWKKPRKIFVCSTSDLFHENVPDYFIDKVFAVMGMAHQHTFQILTKRPERMQKYIQKRTSASPVLVSGAVPELMVYHPFGDGCYPRNVWLGVSVEDQKTADERIPLLLQTPAAVRWISAEPLLGAIDLTRSWLRMPGGGESLTNYLQRGVELLDDGHEINYPALDWVVVGGESGNNARPMHPDWARSLRDQCKAAGVPFLFKQNGEYLSACQDECDTGGPERDWIWSDGQKYQYSDGQRGGVALMRRVGKKAAGRLLDGVLHDEYPVVNS